MLEMVQKPFRTEDHWNWNSDVSTILMYATDNAEAEEEFLLGTQYPSMCCCDTADTAEYLISSREKNCIKKISLCSIAHSFN